MATNVTNLNKNISVLSYNTTGWSEFKGNMICNLLSDKDIQICALQEHMMLAPNFHKIKKHFSQYELFSLPAFKNNNQVHSGRPSCGLAFLYHNKLSKHITRLTCPNSNRVQGLRLNLSNNSYVFINVYLPVDSRNNDIGELIKVIQDIKYIIDESNDSKIILLGDMNCDFSRDNNFVNFIKQFFLDNDLLSVWTKFTCDFTYSQTRMINGSERTYFSVIDHFSVSKDLLENCIDASPILTQDNLSNHTPIF